jgi:16S rRNA (cytidine1402-2'-O)-methyltransferase
VTLVIGGAPTPTADLESAAQEAVELAASGMKLKAAVAQVAQQEGVAKNALYDVALKINHLRRS